MSKFDNNMNEFFGIEDEPNTLPAIKESTSLVSENFDKDLKTDYENSRDTLNELLETGKKALDDMLNIARETEKARDFEVAANMLKILVEANEKSLDIHSKIKDITSQNRNLKEPNKTINNTLFIGSTAELSRIIKDLNNEIVVNE